jgi:hypothetical protein
MTDDQNKPAVTRREALAVAAVGVAAGTQPAMARMLAEKPLRAPPGHQRDNPGFRRLHLEK